MNEVGRRQIREAWSQVGCRASEVREAGGALVFWLGRLPCCAWCALTGRHAWGAWRRSSTFFVPPEQRWCRRCGGTEYRGSWPSYEVRFEVGSIKP